MIPVASMIEDFVAKLDKKVSAEASSLKVKKLTRLLPPLGPRRRKYYHWENNTTPLVLDLPAFASSPLDNSYLFSIVRADVVVSASNRYLFSIARADVVVSASNMEEIEASSKFLTEVSSWLDRWLMVVSLLVNSPNPNALKYSFETSVTMWGKCVLKCRDAALAYFTKDISFGGQGGIIQLSLAQGYTDPGCMTKRQLSGKPSLRYVRPQFLSLRGL